MPGKPTSGNRTAQRGKPTRLRYRLTKNAALKLKLLAWQHYSRPTTEDEDDQFLSQLIIAAPTAAQKEGRIMESQTYRTLIGCCTTPADELIVEALYATPTLELAEAAAALANARGYKTTGATILEELYD